MFQKKFRYMAAVLAALMITQGSFTAFADETQKRAFYDRITANIEDEALKC